VSPVCSIIPLKKGFLVFTSFQILLHKLVKHCRESLWRIPMALLEMVRLEEADRNIKVIF
jgi:hypothetical protein